MKKKREKKKDASPIKIAFYIQNMLDKKIDIKEVMLIISSQFNKESLAQFAETYKDCSYIDDIRHIANIIYSIPPKDINKALKTFAHDIFVKRTILSKDQTRTYRKLIKND